MELQTFLDALPDAVVVVNDGGRVRYINDQTLAMFGCAAKDLLGEPVEVLLPPSLWEVHARHVASYMTNPTVRPMGAGLNLSGRRWDGTTFPVEISLSPLSMEGNTMVVAVVRDVTPRALIEAELRAATEGLANIVEERTRRLSEMNVDLRQERDHAQRILQVAGVMLVGVNSEEEITLINPAGEEILGRAATDVIGTNWFLYVPEAERDVVRRIFHDILAGRIDPIQRCESHVERPDGSLRFILWHKALIRDEAGKSVGTLSSGADLTEQRRSERKLRDQESLAQLGQMAAVIAHEIKNPLAAVKGAVQVMRDSVDDDHPSRSVAMTVIQRIDDLAATVGDLLSFARPRRGEPIPIALRTLVERTVEIFRRDPDAEHVDIQILEKGTPARIRGDVQQLGQVLYNLLTNATQAMAGKGRIRIHLSAGPERCSITVEDTGPGIPETIRSRIFEPFFTTKVRGTGLGLPTCRRIIMAHDGEIDVQCPEAGGTRVRLTLPIDTGDSSPVIG
jgi:PAS domain S-box-containing protein